MAKFSDFEITIRPLQAQEVPKLQQLLHTEDFNYSSDYTEFCRKLSKGCFLVAVGKDGEIISHCGGTYISTELGFIAYFITQPRYRRKGIGRQVLQACMKAFGDINVGLKSRADKQVIYLSVGFRVSSFYVTNIVGAFKMDRLSKMLSGYDVKIVDLDHVHIAALEEYDDSVHNIPRHDFLKKWLRRDYNVCKVAMEGEKIVGYGCMWPTTYGYRVMPLYANSKSAALILWKEFCSKAAPGESVQVAAPSENVEAIKLFTDTVDLVKPMYYSVQMFTKEHVKVNLNSAYSICNGLI